MTGPTRGDVPAQFQAENVDPSAYDLDGGRGDGAYVLEEQRLDWSVYYSERGLRTGEKVFARDQDACAYIRDQCSTTAARDAGKNR